MKSRTFHKVLAVFVFVIGKAILPLDFNIRHTWENSLQSDIERLLVQNARGFALRIQNDHQHSLQQMAEEQARITETRVTLIAGDGTVLAATAADPKTLQHHARRPADSASLTA